MNLKTKSRYFTLPNATTVELLDKPLWIEGNIFMEHYQNLSLTDIEGEVWKQIEGHKGFISNFGRVKLPKTYSKFGKLLFPERIKKQQNVKGYKLIGLGHRKSALIHRLVAQAFIPNPNNLPQVNHKNFIRHDNHVENLEWCTQDDNNLHAVLAGKATLSMKTARKKTTIEPPRFNITYVYLDNGEFYNKYNNFKEVKKEIGISGKTIKRILDKPTSYLGFAFRTKYTKTIEPIVEPLKTASIKVQKIYYIRKQPNENKNILSRKPIKSISRENGKELIFESIEAAARHFNTTSNSVRKSMRENYCHREQKFIFAQIEQPKETQLILF